MLKKLIFVFAFIAFVVVGAFTVSISSVKNNLADTKLTNIEVLADTEDPEDDYWLNYEKEYCLLGEITNSAFEAICIAQYCGTCTDKLFISLCGDGTCRFW